MLISSIFLGKANQPPDQTASISTPVTEKSTPVAEKQSEPDGQTDSSSSQRNKIALKEDKALADSNTTTPLIQAETATPPFSQPIAHKISGKLQPGDTLSDSLSRHQEIPSRVKRQIIDKLSSCLDLRRLKSTDNYTVFLGENNELISCQYQVGPLESYTVKKKDGELATNQDAVPLEVKTRYISGEIENSLFGAFNGIGEESSLVYAFADIFASKINFNREVRSGDKFEALCEKYYKDSEFIGYGNILYASYTPAKGEGYEGFFYNPENDSGAYYDPDGKELGTFFLKTPLEIFRVSSGFTWKREHPILDEVRPHLGVDLAAPTGTPVRAVADGKITFKGKRGGFGNQVIITHRNNHKTYYGHLSRFSGSLSRGDKVKQKQVIGYVGSTGLSTGPHLDYRLKRGDKFVDPMNQEFKPRSILEGRELALFREKTSEINTMLAKKEDKKNLPVKRLVFNPGDDIDFF